MHPSVIPTLGTAHFMLGMLAEAAEILDMGVESARAADVSQGIAWSLHNRAYLAWLTGEVSDGLAMAAEAMERAARLDDNIVSAWAGLIFAVLSLPGGSSEEALEALLKAARGDRLPAIAGSWRVMGLDVLARTYIALGRGDEAARAANLAAEQASVLGLPVATAWARRALAAVALDSGDHAAAAELAIASASVAESAGVVVEGAFSRVLAGRALAGRGASDAAAAEFEHAAGVFERCGAERHRDAAEQELRRLGRHVHRRTRRGSAEAGGIGALTGRELEVADLVVGRRTNPEIAAELFLSRKTVETHLRNIFRKVDVSSRMELAQAMDNAGRARPERDR
jgi:DNA-binding NarL/FixJ family response regulator